MIPYRTVDCQTWTEKARCGESAKYIKLYKGQHVIASVGYASGIFQSKLNKFELKKTKTVDLNEFFPYQRLRRNIGLHCSYCFFCELTLNWKTHWSSLLGLGMQIGKTSKASYRSNGLRTLNDQLNTHYLYSAGTLTN